MNSRFAPFIVFGLVLCGPKIAHAGYALSLTADANLTELRVGDTVTLTVGLSGASPTTPLDALGATVEVFPTGSGMPLGVPTLTAGEIVPDAGVLFTSTGTGFGDATYDALFSPTLTPITTEGTFFTLEFVAQEPGSGVIDFTFAGGFSGLDPVEVQTWPPGGLAFQIEEVEVVPAPQSSILMLLIGCLTWAGWSRLRATRLQTVPT